MPRVKKIKKDNTFRFDLNIHTPNSLSYIDLTGVDNIPAIINLAKIKEIDAISVTDYYTCPDIDRLISAGNDRNILIIPGLMLRCKIGLCDQVLISCLFRENTSAEKIEEFLKELEIPASAAFNENYVIEKDFGEVLKTIKKYKCICIPNNMDKTPSRQVALEKLVEVYNFRTFDLAHYPNSINYFEKKWPRRKFKYLNFSNANALAQIGNRHSDLALDELNFTEIKKYINNNFKTS